MRRNISTVRSRLAVGARRAVPLLIVFTLLSSALAAGEDGKPAQRKRLAGIKPFTKEQMEDFLSDRVLIVLKPTKIQAWGPVPREAAKP